METKLSRRDFLKLPASFLHTLYIEQTPETPSPKLPDINSSEITNAALSERVHEVEQTVSIHGQELLWQGDYMNELNYVLYELATYVLNRLPPTTLPPRIEVFLINHREKIDQDTPTS